MSRALRLLEGVADIPLRRIAAWSCDLGLSLAAVVLIGLVLDLLPTGLSLAGWVVGLLVVTLSSVVVAALGDYRIAHSVALHLREPHREERHQDGAATGTSEQFGVRGPDRVVVNLPAVAGWVVAAAVSIGAVTYSVVDARHVAERSTFTQLALTRGTGEVFLDVYSSEQARSTYSISVHRNGRLRKLLPAFALAPGARHRVTYAIPSTAEPEKISFRLHRAPDPETYREVHYWTATPVPRP